MQFKRQLSYYVFTIYIPTFMTVCVSWMSFWLDHKSAPARVALTITTLLAMATTTASINSSMPPVAYTKVIYSEEMVQLDFLVFKSWKSFCSSNKANDPDPLSDFCFLQQNIGKINRFLS